MKRLLLCLVPWMVAMATASETPVPAEVVYTHVGALRSGVFRVGEDCFVDPESVAPWGWSVSISGNLADVQAEGRRFKVPIRSLNGKKLIPLQAAVKELGATGGWRPGSNTFEVLGKVTSIEVADGAVEVQSSLAGKPRVFFLKGPDRIVIDIQGVRADNDTKVLLGPGARAAQFRSDTYRVVVEAPVLAEAAMYRPNPTRRFEYRLASQDLTMEGGIKPLNQDDVLDVPPGSVEQGGPPPAVPVPQDPTAKSGALEVVSESASVLELRLKLSGKLGGRPNFRRVDASTVAVWLPGSKFEGDQSRKLPVKALERWDVEQAANGAIYNLKLVQPMGVELSSSAREVQIRLIKPEGGNGRLAGKTIVVDAGHGGQDVGARSPDKKTREKDLTLEIATKLSARMAAQGATVIMTRKTDVFVPLKERSEIANRAGADLFVAVHINSSGSPNKTSGGITFYHKQSPIGQLLAECVQTEIGRVSNIPSIGTWSDTRIYSSGFAVLRYASMPAILIEMGFINHATDRSVMQKSDWQDSVAKAIVKGVRTYFGDVKTEENASK